MSRVVHVLWSPQSGPICAYEDPTLAWTHARTMLGVDVAQTELREDLPEVAREDIENYDRGETTPVEIIDDPSAMSIATAIEIDEIDDAPKPSKK